MSNVKISELPIVNSVVNGDVLPVVASSNTSQLSVLDLANSLPQVTSSISASYAVSASYVDVVSASYALSSSRAVTSSFAISASWAPSSATFPFTGDAQINGLLGLTGSLLSDNYVQGNRVLGSNWSTQTFGGTKIPAFGTIFRQDSYNSSQTALGYTYYFGDNNIGHAVPKEFGSIPAGAIKLVRQQSNTVVGAGPYGAGEGKVPIYTIISDNFSLIDDNTNYNFSQQNGRDHVLTVTGSILSKDGVSLGSNLTDNHIISGSVNVVGGGLALTGSLNVTGSIAVNTSGSFILPGTASASPVAGNFYFDFTNNKLYAYNGGGWVTASLGA